MPAERVGVRRHFGDVAAQQVFPTHAEQPAQRRIGVEERTGGRPQTDAVERLLEAQTEALLGSGQGFLGSFAPRDIHEDGGVAADCPE